ncbi:MAG TPA: serine hydrolase domain-containing protein [Candidatus Acidoferrum sp.]|jgi:D-alanyl-D-alanine carboxypeptidase|nr:serine hydrolase domain-containing protein [Candidatus Acidoferrum sp.]
MKCSFLVVLGVLVALSSTDVAGAVPGTQLSPGIQNAIGIAVNKELAAYGGSQPVPGAVVGVWVPGRGEFARGFGYAHLATRSPMALDDRFRIGSNTKTFVATVLLQLVDERKLSLDDTIGQFNLGVHVPNEKRITLRQLAEMRSGIVDAYSIPAVQKQSDSWWTHQTPKQWVAIAAKEPPLFAPGAKYNYSNTNWFLLGLVIEKVTHDTIQNEIHRRILAPMSLGHTSFPTTNWGMPTPYAHGYSLNGKGQWSDESAVLAPSVSWAAGAMISDMGDMKRWVKAYVTGTTNGAASQRARLTCLPTGEGNLSFGLGIGCSAGWYGYTGGITGYNTGAYYMPAAGATVVVFVNSQREKPFPGVANAIFRDIAKIVTPKNVPFVK